MKESSVAKGRIFILVVLALYFVTANLNMIFTFNFLKPIVLLFSLIICWYFYLGHPRFTKILTALLSINAVMSFIGAYRYPYWGDWIDELLILHGAVCLIAASSICFSKKIAAFLQHQRITNEHKWSS